MLTVDVCFYDPKRENYLLVIQTLLLLTCLLQKDTNQLKGVLVFNWSSQYIEAFPWPQPRWQHERAQPGYRGPVCLAAEDPGMIPGYREHRNKGSMFRALGYMEHWPGSVDCPFRTNRGSPL